MMACLSPLFGYNLSNYFRPWNLGEKKATMCSADLTNALLQCGTKYEPNETE